MPCDPCPGLMLQLRVQIVRVIIPSAKYPLPLHKGAIRYYKEIGMWNAEREAKNQARLAHQAKLKKVWDAAFSEALEKKMKMRKFNDFWIKKRAEAGF